MGRPPTIVPPRPKPLVQYIELSDREKISLLVELLEWAIDHDMPLKI
jgi:hypothetical protein